MEKSHSYFIEINSYFVLGSFAFIDRIIFFPGLTFTKIIHTLDGSLKVINHVHAQIIQDKQENMSTGSQEIRKMKGLKVLELFDQGYSYRRIAKLLHLSLRDVTKFIKLAADKTRTPSTSSIHDLIILEYRVNLMRSEVRDLTIERESLMNELVDLRAQKYELLNQLRTRQSELDAMTRDLQYERFSTDILKNIFT